MRSFIEDIVLDSPVIAWNYVHSGNDESGFLKIPLNGAANGTNAQYVWGISYGQVDMGQRKREAVYAEGA